MSDAILMGTAVPPSRLAPSAPPEIEQIIGRAMARDLDYRYRDAGELYRDLRNFQMQLSHISTAPLPLPVKPMAPMPPMQASPLMQPHPQNPLRTTPPAPDAPYGQPQRRQRNEW
jgi:hypothetical protein